MYKIKSWKDMDSWLKFFVLFSTIGGIIMVGGGIGKYLSGGLNNDYFKNLLFYFLMMFSMFGMFGMFSKDKKK